MGTKEPNRGYAFCWRRVALQSSVALARSRQREYRQKTLDYTDIARNRAAGFLVQASKPARCDLGRCP